MIKGLFDGFDSVSTKQWKQKIQFDLNGADFNDTLIWNSNEDIAVKPFYNADDLKKHTPSTSNISPLGELGKPYLLPILKNRI
ncbi:methylmalonyl-CoA mutase small subunit [Algibacter lectus]|uniref:Methylmalonyl-CoA mutase small subunit n=1 Tax=Algibacter lectus TaxID=221126 RepID=A0A090WWQ4_9FLAO|nr:methylmalonyl-CoA mutase small subunit [Algibacter lectus]